MRRLENCVSRAATDLNYSSMKKDDKSTWTRWRTHFLRERIEPVATFAPKVATDAGRCCICRSQSPQAWDAMCDLLGGEDRINPASSAWGDSFIVNLGTEEIAHQFEEAQRTRKVETFSDIMDPATLTNWHVDGDFFGKAYFHFRLKIPVLTCHVAPVHYLDSPEQALLPIPIFSPIEPMSGGTFICPTAIPIMAKYLADHPEGVVPAMQGFATSGAKYLNWSEPLSPDQLPRGTPAYPPNEAQYADPVPEPRNQENPERLNFLTQVAQAPGMVFREMTGQVGDVVLMHPLMLHSTAPNWRRALRVILNPPVALRSPFCFDRADGKYSLVEQKTLMAVGAWDHSGDTGRLPGWKIQGERRRIVPKRLYGTA